MAYTRHKREENYEVMSQWADRGKNKILVINGDFNARTDKEGGLWSSTGDKEERNNKDETLNGEGDGEMARREWFRNWK